MGPAGVDVAAYPVATVVVKYTSKGSIAEILSRRLKRTVYYSPSDGSLLDDISLACEQKLQDLLGAEETECIIAVLDPDHPYNMSAQWAFYAALALALLCGVRRVSLPYFIAVDPQKKYHLVACGEVFTVTTHQSLDESIQEIRRSKPKHLMR